METKKSHHLPCAGWRPRNITVVIQFESKDKNPGTLMSEGRNGWLFLLKQREQIHLPPLFCSIWPSTDWIMAALTGEGLPSLYNLSIQMLISAINSLRGTPRNNVCLIPIKLTDKIIITRPPLINLAPICMSLNHI